MCELLAHLIGDYVLQNHWMAMRKTHSFIVALVHGFFYALPFIILFEPSWWQILLIQGSHVLIDYFRVASWWKRFWGVGEIGWLPGKLLPLIGYKPIVKHSGNDDNAETSIVLARNFPASNDIIDRAPVYLDIWLLILIDNTLHLSINHLVLGWS